MASQHKVYWDSCAWLGLANGEEDRKFQLQVVYGQARKGILEIWSSTLSIVEANRLSDEMGLSKPIPPESLVVLDALLFQPFVKLAAVDVEIARRARVLVRETPKLSKKADAVHLATALRWNVPIMHTYDGSDLLHLDGKMTCADGTRLTICEPSDPNEGDLFVESQGKPRTT